MRIKENKWAYWLMAIVFALSFCAAHAEEPIAMLTRVTDAVLAQLKTHRAELKANPGRIYSIAEKDIVPHVDFIEMGKWIVGRNAWGKASSSEQQDFIVAFKTLVVRTYATSLLGYTNQTVEFLPIRGAQKDRIQVSSYIKSDGRSPVKIDYRLLKSGDSWKVYDIVIEGVSLLKSYQAQFSTDARQHGISHVTARIERHNAQIGGGGA